MMFTTYKKRGLILLSVIIAALLCLVGAFILTPQKTAAAEDDTALLPDTHAHTNAYTGGDLTADGSYYLNTNISGGITVAGNVTLCLNGHNITGDGSGPVITVVDGATFILCDCEGTGCITGGMGKGGVDGGGGVQVNGGTFIMAGGNISNNSAMDGGGVCIADGVFTMTGGKISGNTATINPNDNVDGYGGGVFVAGGAFTMTGGEISGNIAEAFGGGVCAADGESEMSGGTISGNSAKFGGGVSDLATFTMSGGTINGNTATLEGGGVYAGYGSTFNVLGAPRILGNTTNANDNDISMPYAEINVIGALEKNGEKARIGLCYIDVANTTDYGANNKDANGNIISPSTYFVSNVEGYAPTLDNGEVKLAQGVATVTFDGTGEAYADFASAWTAAIGKATTADKPAVVAMFADATTTDTLTVAEGKNITLDLNGHMLKMTGNGSVIKVNNGGNFTLNDSEDLPEGQKTPHNYYVSTDEDTKGLWVFVEDSYQPTEGQEIKTLYGGVVCGGATTYGGGVDVRAGGIFNLTDGTISGNNASYGGGVCVSGSAGSSVNITFSMTGGRIAGNTASKSGGGVDVYGPFKMTGGSINGNTSATAGGVCVGGTWATFEVSGAPNIVGNSLMNGAESNVCLYGKKIIVTGELTEGAKIGVFNTGEIATGFTHGKASEYFISDDEVNNCAYVGGASLDIVNIGPHSYEKGRCKNCGRAAELYWHVDGDGVLILSSYKTDGATLYGVQNYWRYDKQRIKSVVVDRYAYAPQDIYFWFVDCRNLESVDLRGLDTLRVTDMHFMFSDCERLESIDLSSFNTEKVTSMNSMFQSCKALKSLDLSKFNTANVTDMHRMFNGCERLESIDLSSFNTEKVTDMSNMFQSCKALKSLDLTKFNTANVTDMSYMFYQCENIKTFDLSAFNTAKVTDMSYMFIICSGLESIDLSSFNTENVENMGLMFHGCGSLQSLVFPADFKTSKVQSMQQMFKNCSVLKSLDLSAFDTANVTSMGWMFDGCSSLETLVLSASFTTADVTKMNSMFNGCGKLAKLDLSSFVIASETNVTGMLDGCVGLNEIATPKTIGAALTLPDDDPWWNGEHDITSGLIEDGDNGKTIYRHAQCVDADAVSENEVAAKCIEVGSYDEVVYCKICHAELSRTHKTTEIDPDNHDFGSWHPEVGANCTDAGTKGYKDCSLCSKHFDSENAQITDLTIPALGHTVVTDSAVAPTCTDSGKTEGTHCSVCGEILVGQITVDPLGHTLNYNPAVAPTNDQNGNIEFWDCEDCNKFFADEDGKEEITDRMSVIVPKLIDPLTGGGISGTDILWITLIVVLSTAILIEVAVIVYRAKRKFRAKEKK